MITDTQLLYLNQQGLIPGPDEDETTFLRRADTCLALTSTIKHELGKEIPFRPEDIAPQHLFTAPHTKTKQLFDVTPSWIPVFFSNQHLALWHGGCAWICQLKPNDPPTAFFQLRKPFASREVYLGLYHRDDLVAHELSHVGRMAFEEPQFEEVIAYQTARSGFQRWFGPILIRSKEAWIFIVTLLMVLIADIFLPPMTALGTKLIPLGLMTYALTRLWKRHRVFDQCRKNLDILLQNPCSASAVLYRLTDEEIRRFASSSQQDILGYAYDQSKKSLRWRLLLLAYFGKRQNAEGKGHNLGKTQSSQR